MIGLMTQTPRCLQVVLGRVSLTKWLDAAYPPPKARTLSTPPQGGSDIRRIAYAHRLPSFFHPLDATPPPRMDDVARFFAALATVIPPKARTLSTPPQGGSDIRRIAYAHRLPSFFHPLDATPPLRMDDVARFSAALATVITPPQGGSDICRIAYAHRLPSFFHPLDATPPPRMDDVARNGSTPMSTSRFFRGTGYGYHSPLGGESRKPSSVFSVGGRLCQGTRMAQTLKPDTA